MFYSTCLLLLSLSMIIEVVVLYLATAQHKRRLPDFLKRLLNGNLGTWLHLSYFSNENESRSAGNGNGIVKELDEHIYDNDDDHINPLDINSSEMPSTRALSTIGCSWPPPWIAFASLALVWSTWCCVLSTPSRIQSFHFLLILSWMMVSIIYYAICILVFMRNLELQMCIFL